MDKLIRDAPVLIAETVLIREVVKIVTQFKIDNLIMESDLQ